MNHILCKKTTRKNNINNIDDGFKKLPLSYPSLLAIDCKKMSDLLDLCKSNSTRKVYHSYYVTSEISNRNFGKMACAQIE